MDLFPESQTNPTIQPNFQMKKKSTSLQDILKQQQQQQQTATHETSETKSTPLQSLSKDKDEPSPTPIESPPPPPVPIPIPPPEPQQPPAEWIQVSDNHPLLTIFPTLFPPQTNFPMFTFWITFFLLLTFYGRHPTFRKFCIAILCIILWYIFSNWNIYLALWNEGDYMGQDPWFDWMISTSLSTQAQSDAEAKGILFFLFLVFTCLLQIFLYFYHPTIQSHSPLTTPPMVPIYYAPPSHVPNSSPTPTIKPMLTIPSNPTNSILPFGASDIE